MAEREDPAVRGGEKGGRASLHSPKVSAAQIQVYLKGMDYPSGKQGIISKAKENGAPDNVMAFLNRLPEREYRRPNEVEQEFGKMKSA
ncbi:MAG: DUF2795 domain-containing protein [Chloroflexi bacterium]|nr:DUF2795 domain-containing protein [Chloroflexota bacterium]